MRVALTFPGCYRKGGVERVLLECANFLHERGHETHVYASEWEVSALHPAVIRHQVTARMKPALLRPVTFTRQSQQDIANAHLPADVVGGFGVQCPPGGVVWVQSVQKAWLEISRVQRDFKGRLKQRCNPFHPLILAMEADLYGKRRYGKVVALTEQVKYDLMRLYAVPEQDIVIIPNGFAPEEFNLDRRKDLRDCMRRKSGYRTGDKVVIFVANELERKGFGPLLRGIAALSDASVHLLAVGRLNAQAYAAEISRLGMTERVQFVGPSSDVASYYAVADLFALPTQYEAWGLVITEAMACGLPVLTSRLAGAAIAVREGETGLLLDDPNNAAEITAKLKPLLQGEMASEKAIADAVAEYAWPQVLTRYEAVLQQCAAARKASFDTDGAH